MSVACLVGMFSNTLMCVTRLKLECAHMCDTLRMRACVWHVLLVRVRWVFMCVCDMSHSYVWHVSSICLIHMCDMSRSHAWHVSFICVTWLVHMCDMSHSYVWHDYFIFVTRRVHVFDKTSWILRNMTRTPVWWEKSFDSFLISPALWQEVMDLT